MLKARINTSYPHHYTKYSISCDNLYVADYTEQTASLPVRRSIEFFLAAPPVDISFFSLINDGGLEIGFLDFDNRSFVSATGEPQTQCECVVLPHTSTDESWIAFIELKYSSVQKNNANNLTKAISQLLATQDYYFNSNIISRTNTSYLFASLPPQSIPFAGFSLSASRLISLKRNRNIVLKLRNDALIKDNKIIYHV